MNFFPVIFKHRVRSFEVLLTAVFLVILPLSSAPGASIEEAKKLAREGRFVDSMLIIDQIFLEEPLNPDGHFLYGYCLVKLKRYREAKFHLGRALALDENAEWAPTARKGLETCDSEIAKISLTAETEEVRDTRTPEQKLAALAVPDDEETKSKTCLVYLVMLNGGAEFFSMEHRSSGAPLPDNLEPSFLYREGFVNNIGTCPGGGRYFYRTNYEAGQISGYEAGCSVHGLLSELKNRLGIEKTEYSHVEVKQKEDKTESGAGGHTVTSLEETRETPEDNSGE